MRRVPRWLALLLLGGASGGCTGNRQLALTLLTPETWSDAGALDARSSFTMQVTWDGGNSEAATLGVGTGFSISVPSGVPLDLLVFGTPLTGGNWRGELHGLTVPAEGTAEAGLLMLPVGQVGSFSDAGFVLTGAAVAPLGLGTVLVTGDSGDGGNAFVWDQMAVAFRSAPATGLAWAHHAMVSTGVNDQFLLAGGDFAGTSIEYYTYASDAGSVISSGVLPIPQLFPSLIVESGGNVYLGCGVGLDGQLLDSDAGVTQVDGIGTAVSCSGGALVALDAGVFAVGPNGTFAVNGSSAAFSGAATPRIEFAALPDTAGGVWEIGGFVDGGTSVLASSDIDDQVPGGGDFPLQPLSEPRANHVIVDDGASLLAIGGIGPSTGPLSDLEVLSKPLNAPGTQIGAATLVPLGQPRSHPAAILIPGYRIVLILSGEKTVAGQPAPGIDFYAVP